MKEQDIQRQILEYLRGLPGCWAVKVMQANKNGVPDILVCFEGRFIGLEVKAPAGRLSLIQAYQMQLIRESGGVAEVVRSLADAKAAVQGDC
jgi:hypothetical protein